MKAISTELEEMQRTLQAQSSRIAQLQEMLDDLRRKMH
jgi:hypothetical protein